MDDQLSAWPPMASETDRATTDRRPSRGWGWTAALCGAVVVAVVWAPFLGPLAGTVALVALAVGAASTLVCAGGSAAVPRPVRVVAAGTRRAALVLVATLGLLAGAAVFAAMAADPAIALAVGAALLLGAVGVRELACA
ncbi:MAG TPA: hypothetical protein VK866_18780 [Acidimicrobiales bacterium]|nr:hypothetical protein [Acidimicrobiales bacterium]